MTPRILIVDNDPEMVSLLDRHCARQGWAVTGISGGRDALEMLAREHVDVVLTDLVMDDVDGLKLLREAQSRPDPPRVVIMTAFATVDTAIEAIRQGAYDYLRKPFKLDEATIAVGRALADRRLHEENRRLRDEVAQRVSFQMIVGRSSAMRAVLDQVRAVSESDAPVLLVGESGTGKELVARAIHRDSSRSEQAFVAVNCGAIPDTLLESELFGHEKGAFTGADRKRRGLFAEASGGTLFLDEVGDIPLQLQVKLLRVLQDRMVRPVGGSQDIHLDFRLISATHRDLPALVNEGRFREDLYYRLAVIPIRVPSLRERPDDIPLLATHFLEQIAQRLGKRIDGFDAEATAWLLRHRWPGNVRELENMVERAATLTRNPSITFDDLGIQFAADCRIAAGLRPTLADLEDQYVRRVLEETRGDKHAAARILGVSLRTLQRKFR
jgi:DNA-binding NtrC family response regulator